MSAPIESAVIVTAVLAVICVFFSRAVNGTLVSACTVFWAAWLGLTAAAWYCEWQTLVPPISDTATRLVELGEVGAAAGCLIGSIAGGRVLRRRRRLVGGVTVDLRPRTLYAWMALLAAAGLAYFLESLSAVGWNPLSLLFEIRLHFVHEGLTPLGRACEYLSSSTIVLAVLMARRDAADRFRITPIVMLICANAPLGFATGGRGFLVAPIIYYACAYMLAARGKPHQPEFVKPKGRFAGLGLIAFPLCCCIVFTGLGEWRWGATSDRPFYLRVIDTVLLYPALSFTSIAEFSDIYADTSADGRLLIEWPATQLERIGVLSSDTREDQSSVREAVYGTYGGAGNNPPTIIPYLIGDFGESLMPVYFCLIIAIAQVISVRVNVADLLGHSIATMAIAATFFTIQTAMFLHSAHCLALLWVGIVLLLSKRKTSRFKTNWLSLPMKVVAR